MKKTLFKIAAKINRIVLPRYSQRDFTKLSTVDKLIVGYRYWITKNSL